MNPQLPTNLAILQQACQRYGYRFRIVDDFSKRLAEVSNGQKNFVAGAGALPSYPLNPAFAQALATDKAWMNQKLFSLDYKIPQGDYFFITQDYQKLRPAGKEKEDAVFYAEKLGYPVFVKPNRQSLGRGAEVIYSSQQLADHLKHLATLDYIALIQEVIHLPEYRIFVVEGEVQFMYQKSRPQIVGDGKQSVRRLIEQLNGGINYDRNHVDLNSFFLQGQLVEKGLTLDSILPQGQWLKISSHANLSAGGKISNYHPSASKKVNAWAKKLTQEINLSVCGIDVFVDGSIEDPENFTILEVNSNPSLKGIYELGEMEKVMEVWRKVLRLYFKSP